MLNDLLELSQTINLILQQPLSNPLLEFANFKKALMCSASLRLIAFVKDFTFGNPAI
jgi:hypothetical protein